MQNKFYPFCTALPLPTRREGGILMNYISQFMVDHELMIDQRFRLEEADGTRWNLAFYFDRHFNLFIETPLEKDIKMDGELTKLLSGDARIWDKHECSDENLGATLSLLAKLEKRCGVKAPNVFAETAHYMNGQIRDIHFGIGYRNANGQIQWYDDFQPRKDETHDTSIYPDRVDRIGALVYLQHLANEQKNPEHEELHTDAILELLKKDLDRLEAELEKSLADEIENEDDDEQDIDGLKEVFF